MAILRFFVVYAPLVYFGLGLWAVLTARGVWLAWREGRTAVFGLERQLAHQRLARRTTSLILALLLLVGQLFLESFLAPALPAAAILPTPTANLMLTPTETLALFILSETPPPSEPPASQVSGCIPGQIMITFPEAGMEIRGQVTLSGSADVPNFGFYKYEVSPLGTEQWTTISAGNTVVRDAELGRWDTGQLTPGDYLLRLVVTDNQGNSFPPCVIAVRVLAP
ncbi:MAG: hypothetical protein ABWK53_11350 [Anaerolineales bacterium]